MTMTHRPKGMTYKAYMAKAKDEGDEPMEEKDYDALPEEKDEGEDEDEEESEKAVVALDDLQKALDGFAAQRETLGAGSRAEYLEARLRAGTLSKGEREELGRIWSGDADPALAHPSNADIRKSMEDDDGEAARLVDISPVLGAMEKAMTRAMNDLGALMKSESGRVHAQVAGLADTIISSGKATLAMGRLVKSLEARLAHVEATPTPRRGVTTPPGSSRSRQIGPTSSADQLTKGEVSRGIDILLNKAVATDDDTAIEALSLAAARWESGVPLDPNTQAAIRAVVRPN